jgi:hypothetical protein
LGGSDRGLLLGCRRTGSGALSKQRRADQQNKYGKNAKTSAPLETRT